MTAAEQPVISPAVEVRQTGDTSAVGAGADRVAGSKNIHWDSSALPHLVEAWIADDPDPQDQAELQALLDGGAGSELAERFRGSLRFGTAGLRGPLGAGPSRMNVATVRRASAGLAAYLAGSVPQAALASVVIGYDARHGSKRFADEAARVISGSGLRVLRLPGQLPTPVLGFAVRRLACTAGVMITASHNPAEDNGYKVFLANGAQIAPPADREIAIAIDAVGPLLEVALGDLGEPVGEEIVSDYLDAVIAALPPVEAHDITTVYTPLHGVGRGVLLAAFARAGFPPPHVVPAQGEPDPDFPTVPKPNPEEPGALDLAIAEACTLGADLVLANDPDADRLAVAVPTGAEPGAWRLLRGDELGVLLGDFLLAHTSHPEHALLVSTVVSSSLLGHLAQAAGAQYIETLTGFKWIMHDSAAHTAGQFMFGYEQALGYAVNDVVRDKDGISAALLVAAIAATAKRRGRAMADRLDEISCALGLYATDEFSLELPGEAGAERIGAIMAALRRSPPTALLGLAITEVDDATTGIRRTTDERDLPWELPRANVLVWRAGERIRVVVRPSGTEPKLKVYLQVVLAVPGPGDLAAVKRSGARKLGRLESDLRVLLLSSDPVTQ
jgi:phosphomannomutase